MPEITFITKEEIHDFRQAVSAGFGGDASDGDGEDERFLSVFPLETCFAAFDHGRMVGTFGSFDLELTVPGGSVPMAGTTVVTVHPAYRRRGLLTEMMRIHLDQAKDRGQPVAGLWASEVRIYGRYGYGIAAESYELEVDGSSVSAPRGPDDVVVRPIAIADAAELLPRAFEAVCQATPGFFARSDAWWAARNLHDPESWRGGASAKRVVVAEIAGQVEGYILYRQKEKWESFVSNGSVDVIELVASSDGVRRSLWHYITNVDLFSNVSYWNTALDDPVIDEIDNRRALTIKPFDTLWVRLLDVPAALQTRRYETDGQVRFAVTDDFLGRSEIYDLSVIDGEASCVASDGVPELEMDISVLGSIYLGGLSVWRHQRAGRIAGDHQAVGTLDRVFRTHRSPHCLEVF